jgi:hypothetical protein
MSTNLMLRPQPEHETDNRDRIIAAMEQEIRSLKLELGDARRDAENARHQAERAVANLRKQLTPFFRAMQVLFGEMDAIAPEVDAGYTSAMPDKKRAVWESWKQKLGGKKAEFVQAMLDHGEMTAAQLRVATHCGTRTVPDVIYALKSLGLVKKNGSKYSLAEL